MRVKGARRAAGRNARALNRGMIVGFSSHGRKTGSASLSGKDLAVRDLLNHFGTRRGERVNAASFGSDLPFLLFEEMDDRTEALIEDDVKRVVAEERRWDLAGYEIRRGEHSVALDLDLVYLPPPGDEAAGGSVQVTYETGRDG